jgi:hypothetical protein
MTLYERIAKLSEADTVTTRGDLLSRAAKASLGVALVLAGLSRAEQAGARIEPDPTVGCCFLAYTAECANCTGQGYNCSPPCTRWAWYCVDNQHHVWLCGECYASGNCPGCSCGRVSIRTDNTPPLLTGQKGK